MTARRPGGAGAAAPLAARSGPLGPPPDRPPPREGPLGRLGRLAYRRRGRTVLLWLAALAVVAGLSTAYAGEFTADYSARGSDSHQAMTLLEERFPQQAGDTVNVVVRSEGDVRDPAARADVQRLLDQLAGSQAVAAVDDPYANPAAISPDGRTLLAQLRLTVVNPVDLPVEQTEQLLVTAERAERPGLEVALGGQAIQLAEQGEIGSEMLGLAAAAVILLLMFGSLVAAGLPLLVALSGLAVSSMLTGLVAAVMGVPDWATSLATMMGIGIGIDYVLLMVTRFREWRAAGLDPESATAATLDTAGRSVLLAGGTVVLSMLGLFAMGLSYMRGAAVVTILAVLVVMAAAVTLLPALLGYTGRHIDRLRIPLPRRRGGAREVAVSADGHVVPGRGWSRWSRFVERHSLAAAVAGVAVLLALASPFLDVRFGFPDAGNDAEGRTNRAAYDWVAEGFGPGANGPLVLVAELPSADDASSLDALGAAVQATPGVASVGAAQVGPDGRTAVLTVVPTTGPQSDATEDLVRVLRDDTLPRATAGTGVDVAVGGVTASAIDGTNDVARRIPLLLAGVVLLSMVLLLVSFRSVVIAVSAAVLNLLSVAAAYGVVALVLQGGWAGQLIGIDTATPLPAFIPVLMFAVLFGLSMDYEVFLISRMREAWVRTGDNARAIVEGLAGTGRVITAAAAIMIAVFAAFIPSPEVFLKVIGIGMAAAILIDATIVRMLLVPAVMHLFGNANWWMPAALSRRLPQLHVEGRPEAHLPAQRRPEAEAEEPLDGPVAAGVGTSSR
jgi:RND superfamily putative drug exporter